ncbi:MAG TPA: NAD(P)-dependent oxidoreductase [Isosphaeraceae bacterium]|jgi:D-3-phosphoglycerate dehydrogenase|nr:NAD(P)-dependent oxidoreductase [Isosphaeraceae bacterium]
MSQSFRVGLSRDFLKPDGTLGFGQIGLELLEQVPGISWEFLPEKTDPLEADHVAPYDALLLLGPKLASASLENATRLRLVARFGVGYDNVDVDACTRKGILLTITPDGVRRPVATAALAFLLALAHKLRTKDNLTRAGRWHEKLDHMGTGLTGRTLGVIGLGNIGRELYALAWPLEMHVVAHDPYVNPVELHGSGIELVDLESLLRRADFVCICCALTAETHHLINAERLAFMKDTAYLINVARGPIVDQSALVAALRARRIQGAALDVFEREPIDAADPLLELENVIVSPHAICWTDECFRRIGESACRSIVDVVAGRVPEHVVNRAALNHPRWQASQSTDSNGAKNG